MLESSSFRQGEYVNLDEFAQVIGRIEDSTGDYEDIDETEVRAIMRREELIKARFQDTP